MNLFERVTEFNFLPGKGDDRFPVMSKQFNKLVRMLNLIRKYSGSVNQQVGNETATVALETGNNVYVIRTVDTVTTSPQDSFEFICTLQDFTQQGKLINVMSLSGGGNGKPSISLGSVVDGQFTIEITNVGNSDFSSGIAIILQVVDITTG